MLTLTTIKRQLTYLFTNSLQMRSTDLNITNNTIEDIADNTDICLFNNIQTTMHPLLPCFRAFSYT